MYWCAKNKKGRSPNKIYTLSTGFQDLQGYFYNLTLNDKHNIKGCSIKLYKTKITMDTDLLCIKIHKIFLSNYVDGYMPSYFTKRFDLLDKLIKKVTQMWLLSYRSRITRQKTLLP